MISVTIDLEDLSGSWRIIRIVVKKDGAEHHVAIGDDRFQNRSRAEREARMRARFFIDQNYDKVSEGEIVWQVWPAGPSESNPLA